MTFAEELSAPHQVYHHEKGTEKYRVTLKECNAIETRYSKKMLTKEKVIWSFAFEENMICINVSCFGYRICRKNILKIDGVN